MLNVKKKKFFCCFAVFYYFPENEKNGHRLVSLTFWLNGKVFFKSDARETTINSSWPVPKQLPDLSVLLLAVIICVPEWILMPYRTNHSKYSTFFKVSLRLVHFTALCLALVVCAECRCPLLQRHTTIINCVMHHISQCKGIWILESENFLLVKSENFASGIRNTALGIRNPTNNWNPKCKVHCQSPESGNHGVESRI